MIVHTLQINGSPHHIVRASKGRYYMLHTPHPHVPAFVVGSTSGRSTRASIIAEARAYRDSGQCVCTAKRAARAKLD